MPVQLKPNKTVRNAPTAGPSADDRGPEPARGGKPIEAMLQNVVGSSGASVRVMLSRGALDGVAVGMTGYIRDGVDGVLASFEIDQVEPSRAFASVEVARERLRANAAVLINVSVPKQKKVTSGRVIARSVVDKTAVQLVLAMGRDHGVLKGSQVELLGSSQRSSPQVISNVEARRSYVLLEHTTLDEASKYTDAELVRTPNPVQRRANGANVSTGDVEATAQAGVASASSPLPFLDVIQRSFGKHDVSGVRAQIGGPAAAASDALGARAYATGSTVAFASAPDLHTAAHEAAHTVQQARGAVGFQGLGAADDEHERHADAVADAVVAGRSAEALLDGVGGAGTQGGVQRKAIESTGHREASWVAPGHGDDALVGSIFFRTKETKIEEHDRTLLAELASSYATYAKRELGRPGQQLGLTGKVVGYADPRSSKAPENQTLSNRRAEVVANSLERELVSATRVDVGHVHLQRVGAGVDPAANVDDAPRAEGNALAPYRRADIYMSGESGKGGTQDAPASTPPARQTRLHEAPPITLEHDRWLPLILEGHKKTIEGVSARIAVDVGPSSLTGGRAAMAQYAVGFASEQPPWWAGRAARFAHLLAPQSQGRSGSRNARATKNGPLVHDTLLLLRDYKEIHYYEETFLGPAFEAIRNPEGIDPLVLEDHRRALRYMVFMYAETEKLAWKVHRATE